MNIFTEAFLQLMDVKVRDIATALSPAAVIEFINLQSPVDAEQSLQQVRMPESAQPKGVRGEEWLQNVLKARMPECCVIKSASTKWSGDFIITRTVSSKIVSIIIDVKNYKNTVPREEIQKFHRDLEINKCDAGLLLSLGTRFAGQPHNDSDMAFSLASWGGRDINTILLTSTNPSLIVHCLRYLFSLVACEQEIHINAAAIKSLRDVRSRLSQMSKLRYEIGVLNSTVNLSLGRLSNEILDIEVRTDALLDTIFNNINVQEYRPCKAETIEQELKISLRPATMAFLSKMDDMRISEDNRFIISGRATITRMAARDRITIEARLTEVPCGDFTYKDDKVTFELDANNIDLALSLCQT